MNLENLFWRIILFRRTEINPGKHSPITAEFNLKITNRFAHRTLIFLSIAFWIFLVLGSLKIVDITLQSLKKGKIGAETSVFAELMKHVDIVGVMTGILGILVAILLVIIVERKNEHTTEKIISHLTTTMQATLNIWKDVQAGKHDQLSSFTKSPNKIVSLIKDAAATRNDLYIMNFSILHGYLISRNFRILKNEFKAKADGEKEDITKLAEQEMFEEIKKIPINRIPNALMEAIKSSNVNIAVLKNGPDALHKSIAYPFPNKFRFLIEKIINKETIVPIDTMGLKQIITKIEVDPTDNIFFFPVDRANPTMEALLDNPSVKSEEIKELFLKEIISKNRISLDNLYEANEQIKSQNGNTDRLKISLVDSIPFQFFTSIPTNTTDVNLKYESIIIFTNYHNIGEKDAIYSFYTRDPHIAIGLRDLHKSLTDSNDAKDKKAMMQYQKNQHEIQALSLDANEIYFTFNIEDGAKVTLPQHKLHDTELTALRDVDTTYYIRELLKKRLSIQEEKFSTNKQCSDFANHLTQKTGATIFSIGLFRNNVTKMMCSQKGKSRLRLFEKKKGNPVNRIEVDEDHNGTISIQPYVYKEQEKKDYAIISKIIDDNQNSIIICGGIRSIGTAAIPACMEILFEKSKGLTLKGKNFIAVFEVAENGQISEKYFKDY